MLRQNKPQNAPISALLLDRMLMDASAVAHRRADRGVTQCVWKAWHGAVVHHAQVKQTMANAILRFCHRSSAAAFEHWQDYVAASKILHVQQQHAVQRMQKKQLLKICMFWRALAAVTQQHKVRKRQSSC